MAEKDEHRLKVQQLFVKHQGQLKAYVLAICPDFARAEDVLQEVFLTVTAKAQEFELDSSFLAWSRAIARLKLLEAGRATRSASLSGEVLDALAAACPPGFGSDERLAVLAKCKDEQWIGVPRPESPLAEPEPGLAGREEIKLMYDIIVAAMQTDSTRVLTYRQPVGSLLTSLGINVAPHDMSHYHSTMGEKLNASQRRDLAQSELLAGLIDKLKATEEADGSRLFDHVALAYGSNIRTEHSLDNCPTLLTGGGAGIKLGQNLVVPKDTPLCNAWLTLLTGVGVDAKSHGGGTGVIKSLVA